MYHLQASHQTPETSQTVSLKDPPCHPHSLTYTCMITCMYRGILEPNRHMQPKSQSPIWSGGVFAVDPPPGRPQGRRREEERGERKEGRRKKKEERKKKKEERKKKKEERREGESWSQTATCNPISPLSGGDRDLGGFGRPVKYLSSGKRHHQHNTHFFYTEKCFSGVHFSETSSSRRH